jgi:hypothetical protein
MVTGILPKEDKVQNAIQDFFICIEVTLSLPQELSFLQLII